jgi:outer membrane biosynthesis protein TonB
VSTLIYSLILFILLADGPMAIRLTIAPPPRPPMKTVETGLAIITMDIGPDGKPSQIETVQGAAPFVDASIEAVRQWAFEPLKKGQAPVPATALFLYRARTVLPDSGFKVSVPVEPAMVNTPPRPVTVTDPGYPVQSTAEGVVILQLQIDAGGRIQKTDIIQDVPSLTWAATHAVSQWKFAPAMHRGGPVSGVAVAAISFLRPVLSH